MKKVSRTSKKGFTLVELLVVIGIIGLLAAIILPKFTGYTDKAIEKNAISDARNIYTEISAGYADKGQYPVITTVVTNLGLSGTATQDAAYTTAGDFTYVLTKGKKTYTVKYINGIAQTVQIANIP